MTQYTQDQLDTLTAKIKHIDYGMFTTRDASGALTSRPLTQQQLDTQGQMWFFTSDEQAFTRDLLANPQVNVSFTDIHDSLYISLSGSAELLRDRNKAEELWNPIVKAWYPGGLDDPHLMLLKVKVHSAEYWDAHSSRMTQFFAMAKAAVTGERPKDITEHKKIDL